MFDKAIDKFIPAMKKSFKIKHLAIVVLGFKKWAKSHKIPFHEAFRRELDNIYMLLDVQTQYSIPLISVQISTPELTKSKNFAHYMTELNDFLLNLVKRKEIKDRRIKISVLGKWYGLPGYLVDSIKHVMRETKSHDSLFLNLCISYDGQEEIVNACRLIAKKYGQGEVALEDIDKEMIKDNIYSSYFLPPDLIIKTPQTDRSDLLLWDSINARSYYTNKPWLNVTKSDIIKALSEYHKSM